MGRPPPHPRRAPIDAFLLKAFRTSHLTQAAWVVNCMHKPHDRNKVASYLKLFTDSCCYFSLSSSRCQSMVRGSRGREVRWYQPKTRDVNCYENVNIRKPFFFLMKYNLSHPLSTFSLWDFNSHISLFASLAPGSQVSPRLHNESSSLINHCQRSCSVIAPCPNHE